MTRLVLLLLAGLLLAGVSRPAAAYLDPGTGSALLQGLIAGFALLSAGVATFWGRIRALFGSRKDQPPVDR